LDIDRIFRRLIGRNFSDPEVRNIVKELPYDIVDIGGKPTIRIETTKGNVHLAPEDISGLVLANLRSMAETHLNRSVTRAVITVPSDFNEGQRQATKSAAEHAGFNSFRIIDEAIAIGIAYRLDIKPCDEARRRFDCTYLLYDMKGIDLHLTLLNIDKGVFEILGAVRDDYTRLDDIDNSAVQDQAKLQNHSNRLSEENLRLVKQLLIDSKVEKNDIDRIICTGDLTHITEVQRTLEEYFREKKALTHKEFTPDQAVVSGAVIQAGVINEQLYEDGCIGLTMDVNALSFGIETSSGSFLKFIPQGTVIPTRKARVVSTSADGQEKAILKIFEGERGIASENKLIGSLELNGIPTKSKGMPEIEVAFVVDANEVLTVTVKLKGKLEVAEVVVPLPVGRFIEQGTDHIVQEAEKFREDDQQQLRENPMKAPFGVDEWESSFSESDTVAQPDFGFWRWLFG
jgi:molecular chaperone DnaK (HSP70)